MYCFLNKTKRWSIKNVLLLKHHLTWYISCHIIFTKCMLLTTLSNQNQSVHLYLFQISTKFMIKKKTLLSGDLCVMYNVVLWNISFSGWHFLAFYHSCGQPSWQPLVNISLISQFRENVSSFNFLTNTLNFKLLRIDKQND